MTDDDKIVDAHEILTSNGFFVIPPAPDTDDAQEQIRELIERIRGIDVGSDLHEAQAKLGAALAVQLLEAQPDLQLFAGTLPRGRWGLECAGILVATGDSLGGLLRALVERSNPRIGGFMDDFGQAIGLAALLEEDAPWLLRCLLTMVSPFEAAMLSALTEQDLEAIEDDDDDYSDDDSDDDTLSHPDDEYDGDSTIIDFNAHQQRQRRDVKL